MAGHPDSNLIFPIGGIADLMYWVFLSGSPDRTSEEDPLPNTSVSSRQVSFPFDDLASLRLEDALLCEYDPSYWPMDGKIEPLVKAVNVYGLPTVGSCEGHLLLYKPYVDRHPSVVINPHLFSDDRLQKFQEILQRYNQRKPRVGWEMKQYNPYCSLHPEPSGEKGGRLLEENYLRLLQEEAHRLASYIFAEARKMETRGGALQ